MFGGGLVNFKQANNGDITASQLLPRETLSREEGDVDLNIRSRGGGGLVIMLSLN